MKSLVFGDAEDEGGLPLSLLDVDELKPFAPIGPSCRHG